MDNNIVALRDDKLMFVMQIVGCAPDQIEQSVATRFNVRAVLDIVRRPILLRRRVVPLVKQGVEGVEHQRFVFLLYRLTHNNLLMLSLLLLWSVHLKNAHSHPVSYNFDPPSTGMLAPVIQRAASDARNATTSATSSGLPIRFNACIPSVISRPASVFAKFDISVSITPGAIAFTRIPCGPRMAAQFLTRVSSAPLVEV